MKQLVRLAIAIAITVTLLPMAAKSVDAAPSTVYAAGDMVNVRSAPSLAAATVQRVPRTEPIPVTGAVVGQSINGNSTWYRTRSGYYVSATVVSTTPSTSTAVKAGATTKSATTARSGRWIDVNLTKLYAVAMEGGEVVYSTPIVSGRPGWQTPTGTFRVLWRVPLRDMDSTTIGMPKGTPGYYYQPDVPWILYFTPYGHAIHGNDWVPARAFGSENTSHGCVGMPIAASKFFYDFATVGTPVVIHY